jgi:transglutaminase-like putative cysteine protease
MRRDVTARLQCSVVEPALVAVQIAAAHSPAQVILTLDGAPLAAPTVSTVVGGWTQLFECPPGWLDITYSAGVDGRAAVPASSELDRLEALRPSRYCPSDALLATATREFGTVSGAAARITAVTDWVHATLRYVSGSSRGTDGALDTLLAGEGVCRDYAHLVIALLRALDVPARLAAVYAPGLVPMDFHAVVEAWDGERWRLVDATRLAPRESMLRICTGRDAADTAFLTTHHGIVELRSMQVTAVVDELPTEDPEAVVELG